jgi:Domain of unknown function (DUF4266)
LIAARARRIARSIAAALALLFIGAAALGAGGCAMVPQNRRKHLADPMMSPDGDALLSAGRRKLYTSRESAGGGDAAPAGGGCGCQ